MKKLANPHRVLPRNRRHIHRHRRWTEPNFEDNVFRSKAVGKPPLMLAISVFEALRDAVARARDFKGAVQLTAPATAENVLNALAR